MGTWFPPLPGDQPNEPIIPIGQSEEETPEPDEMDPARLIDDAEEGKL